MAGKLTLTIEQGATFRHRLVWRGKNGKPVNLTGWTGKLQFRKTHESPTVILELSTENGRMIFGGVTGTIDLLVTDEDTLHLLPDTYVHDLLLSAPDGSKERLVEGKGVVTPGVTRA